MMFNVICLDVPPQMFMHIFCSVFVVLVEKIERTVQIEASTVEIEERGVKLRLTVVDTPGYGDAINSQDWSVCVYSAKFIPKSQHNLTNLPLETSGDIFSYKK